MNAIELPSSVSSVTSALNQPSWTRIMKYALTYMLAAVAALGAVGQSKVAATAPASQSVAAIVVIDFDSGGAIEPGQDMAEKIRIGLRQSGGQFEVIDHNTTQEGSAAISATAKRADVEKLLNETFAARVAVYGSLKTEGDKVTVEVHVVDLRPAAALDQWTHTYTGDAQRGRVEIASAIVEKITGQAKWVPPQRGDVPEPKKFGVPMNVNGDFEAGTKGWTPIDNVSTFIEEGPKGRGKVLRMNNALDRDGWLEYRRALMFGKANPNNPPAIKKDDSMGGLAGLEGCDIVGDYFVPKAGWRYWLVADGKGPSAAKIFIKGWKKTDFAHDGLSESALAELGLTPEKFAAMKEADRKKLVEADAKKHPTRYLREAYRWQLSCGGAGDWTHWAETFPPRGGLMKNLDYLHVKILTYWPPGESYWDKVNVYADPTQTKPLAEEKPRTPNAGKTSDKVDEEMKHRE